MLWPDCSCGRSREERLRGPLPNLPSRNIHWRRRLSNGLALGAFTLAALIVTMPLFLILATIVYRGLPALNWSFFTQIPRPMGEIGGGMANALLRSLMLLGGASATRSPLGIRPRGFFAGHRPHHACNNPPLAPHLAH